MGIFMLFVIVPVTISPLPVDGGVYSHNAVVNARANEQARWMMLKKIGNNFVFRPIVNTHYKPYIAP
jgi:hypothetical protein